VVDEDARVRVRGTSVVVLYGRRQKVIVLCLERRVMRSIEKRQREEGRARRYLIQNQYWLNEASNEIHLPEGNRGDDAGVKNVRVGRDLRVVEVDDGGLRRGTRAKLLD
jgi:hypothetical protein